MSLAIRPMAFDGYFLREDGVPLSGKPRGRPAAHKRATAYRELRVQGTNKGGRVTHIWHEGKTVKVDLDLQYVLLFKADSN